MARNQKKKRKANGRRFLSGLLCIIMVFSVCSSTLCMASATDDSETPSAAAEQSVSEENDTSQVQENAAEQETSAGSEQETVAESEEEQSAGKTDADQTPVKEQGAVQQCLTAHTGEKAEADRASVTVNGLLPAGTTVTIQAVTEQSKQYDAVTAALNQAKYVSDGALSYDISLWDAAGKEIEPDSTVSVKLELGANLLNNQMAEENLTVVHLGEDQSGAIQKTSDVIAEQDNANLTVHENNSLEATFKTDSFSTFTITWNSYGKFKVTAHYVDVDGKEISGKQTQSFSVSGNSITINTENYFTALAGYEQKEICANAYNGTEIGTTSCTLKASLDHKNQTYVLKCGSTEIAKGYGSSANIYLVYEKISYTVKFYQNAKNQGGTTAFADDITVSSTSDEITLPAPGESTPDGDYIFYGWSYMSEANTSQNSVIYPAGTKITLDSTRFNDKVAVFYAVWSTKGGTARFYVRLDGVRPYEPSNYSAGAYTTIDEDTAGVAEMKVQNALIRYQHIYNDLTAIENNFVVNEDGSKRVPSEETIQKACAKKNITYNPETDRVVWYVIKGSGNGWHVDGVIEKKAKCTLEYNLNASSGIDANAVIPALQYDCEENVRVYGSADTSHNQVDVPLTRTGYTFTGWNTKADGTGTAYAIGDTITMPSEAATITLYAQWIPQNTSYATIQKTIKGLDDNDQTGTLTFTATNTANSSDVKKATLNPSGNGTYLVKLYGLTVDATYTITEGTADVTGYTCETTIESDTVKAPADPVADAASAMVAVTNTYTRQTGTLVIEKQVTAENEARLADVAKKLQGKLTFQIKGQNGIADVAAQQVTTQTAYNKEAGIYTITVKNVPTGSYTVTESNYDVAGYLCTPDAKAAGGSVTVVSGQTATYQLRNDYVLKTGAVSIEKNLIDSEGQSVTAKDDATYLFQLSGTTIAGEDASYAIQVTVKRGETTATTEKKGILYGKYTATELDSVNATFNRWSDGKNAVELSEVQPSDSVCAYNKYDYHFQTDSDVAVNEFKYKNDVWAWIREIVT